MKVFVCIFLACIFSVSGPFHAAGNSPPTRNGQQRIFFWDKERESIEEWQGVAEFPIIANKPEKSQNLRAGQYCAVLEEGILRVFVKEYLVWETPPEWRVDGFELADAMRDGRIDLTMSVWKKGSFGSGRPFWVEENDECTRNHFFIYAMKDDQFLPRWQSSALDAPNCEYSFTDITGDGWDELITIEGFYFLQGCGRGRFVSAWYWNGWTFVLLGRSRAGSFSNLRSVKSGDVHLIMVDENPPRTFRECQ